ncbi:MAG: FxsA family protein [Bdellovibrionota bacterium]
MPILLLLLTPILEIYVMIRVGSQIGFVNTIFALLAGAILGGGMAKAQGRYMLQTFQKTISQGQLPSSQVFHSLLIFIGGILLFIPGFLSDAVGLLLILPGTRHLFALWLRRRMALQLSNGTFRAFSMGGFGGFSGGFSTGGFGSSSNSPESRNVDPRAIDASQEIIDVTPIRKPGSKSDKTD